MPFFKFPFLIPIFDILFSGIFIFFGLGTGLIFFAALSIFFSLFSSFLYEKSVSIVLVECLLLLLFYLFLINSLVYEEMGLVNLLRPLYVVFLIAIMFRYRDVIRIDEMRGVILWLFRVIKYAVILSFLLFLLHFIGVVNFEKFISFGGRFSGFSFELLSASYIFFLLIYLNGITYRYSIGVIIIGLTALYLTKSNFLLIILFAYFISYFQKINVIPKSLSALSIVIFPLFFIVIMLYLILNEYNIQQIFVAFSLRGGEHDAYARLYGSIMALNSVLNNGIDIFPALFGNGIVYKNLQIEPMFGFINMMLDLSWLFIFALFLIAFYYYKTLILLQNGRACISEYVALNVSILYLTMNPVYYSPLPMFVFIFIVRIMELRKSNEKLVEVRL